MRHAFLVAGFICLFLFQNCAPPVNFAQDISSLSVEGLGSEEFKVAFSQNSALDMIWVIDNSGSMTQEAAHVRTNFSKFLTELNQRTNFRLLVVSNKSSFGVSIPSQFSTQTHWQVETTVGSKNGPSLLLSTLGDTGAATNFFRKSSQKVIVFVTDDNSSISATSFLSSLQSKTGWPSSQVMVSSFIGLGKSISPCQAATGTVYSDLSTATEGKNYNICDSDWSAHFDELMEKSIDQAQRRFTLKASNIQQIMAVNVDGKTLSDKDFSFDGGSISLSESVPLNLNSVVKVNYSTLSK